MTRRVPWLPPLLALLAAGLYACTPPNVGEPGDTASVDGGETTASVCSAYAYAYCGRLQACSPIAVAFRYVDIATCESTYESLCANSQSAPETGATPTTVAACIQALPNWACADFLLGQNTPPGCDEALGLRANGSPCAVRQQCQSGYCGWAAGAACGTCATPPQPGDSCAMTECPNGLSCTGAGPTCVAYAQVGESCSTSAPCSDGLTCVTSANASSGTCQAGPATLGASCTFGGAGCDFYAGLTCNAASGTCVTAQFGTAGEACGEVENQFAYCVAGTCARGQCSPYVPIGGACDLRGGAECMASSRCMLPGDGGTTGTCEVNGSLPCP